MSLELFGGLLTRLAEALIRPEFLALWCTLIVAYAASWGLALLRSIRPLAKALTRAKTSLRDYQDPKDFAEGFQRYREVIEREPLLVQPWKEFLKSLVFPAADSEEPIRSTAEPGLYLSDASLIAPRVHARYLSSVPSHLTAFGILGTFLGLAAGVGLASSNLTAADATAVTEGLKKLLSGASLAFITSVFGLFFSLLFLMLERGQMSRLHRMRQEWASELERRLQLVTLEHLGIGQLQEAKEQSKQLRTFNTDLITSLESALEDKVAGRLAPLLETLIERTEALRQDRSTDSTKVIETMIADFTASMNNRTNAEFGSVTAALETAAAKLEAASEIVSRDLGQAGKNASNEIAISLDAFRQGMERLDATSQSMGESIKSAVSDMSEALRSATSNASLEIAQAGVGMSAGITNSLEGFQRGMDRLDGASRSVQGVLEEVQLSAEEMASVRKTIEASHEHLQTSLTSARDLADSIRQSSSEFKAVWNGAHDIVQRTNSSVESMAEQQERMATAWKSYQDRFEVIDDSLARAFHHMNEALERYTEKTLDFGTSLDKQTASAIDNLRSVAGELNDMLADLTDVISQRKLSA